MTGNDITTQLASQPICVSLYMACKSYRNKVDKKWLFRDGNLNSSAHKGWRYLM